MQVNWNHNGSCWSRWASLQMVQNFKWSFSSHAKTCDGPKINREATSCSCKCPHGQPNANKTERIKSAPRHSGSNHHWESRKWTRQMIYIHTTRVHISLPLACIKFLTALVLRTLQEITNFPHLCTHSCSNTNAGNLKQVKQQNLTFLINSQRLAMPPQVQPWKQMREPHPENMTTWNHPCSIARKPEHIRLNTRVYLILIPACE